MSVGLDIAGVVLAGINIAHLAVIAYQEARPGRTAASLHRKLNNEKAIYQQFLGRLLAPYMPASDITKYLKDQTQSPLALKDGDLAKNMRRRLGNETFDLVLQSLEEMDILLKALGSELKNMSAGTKILAKIRTNINVRMATRPMSSVQRNLTQLTEINKELKRLVSGSGSGTRPRANLRRQIARSRFLHREYREPAEVYKTICGVFPCDCDEPHIANIGCQCPSCHFPLRHDSSFKDHKWTIELVLLPTGGAKDGTTISENAVDSQESLVSPASPTAPSGHEIQRPASVSVSLDEPPMGFSDRPTEPINDLCSVINADAAMQSKTRSLGIMGRAKQYDLRLIGHDPDGSTDGHIVTLSDLIRIDNQGLTRRQRMQIAFQLCLSVLQLYTTPWVDEGWSWEESCALRLIEEQPGNDSDDPDEEEKREFPHLFIRQKFYSQGQVTPSPKEANSVFGIVVGDPVLAKLGFALIVLAVNKTLAEVRRERVFCDIIHDDADLMDLATAKKLLETSRIRNEAGVGYEDVVRACIEGQYVDLQDATTRRFRKKRDVEGFYDDAEEAIMNPLFTYCQIFA